MSKNKILYLMIIIVVIYLLARAMAKLPLDNAVLGFLRAPIGTVIY
jgi:hypothetical protein